MAIVIYGYWFLSKALSAPPLAFLLGGMRVTEREVVRVLTDRGVAEGVEESAPARNGGSGMGAPKSRIENEGSGIENVRSVAW